MADNDISYSDKPRYHLVDKRTGRSLASYPNKFRAKLEAKKRGDVNHHIEERSPNPEIPPKRVL